MLIPEDAEIAGLTRTSLASLLHTYAQYPPEDMLPDSQTWGHNAATALLSKVRALPLAAEIAGIADEMLQSHDYKCLWLGKSLAGAATVDLPTLAQALERAPRMEELPAAVVRDLKHTWASAVQLGRIAWNNSMRDSLSEVWAGPLIAAALVSDHAYVLEHLPELLGNDPAVALGRFAGAVESALRAAEGKALQAELRAHQGQWGAVSTKSLIDAVQWYLDNGSLPAGAIRW